MTFLLNHQPVDALALIVNRSVEDEVGHRWVKKLRTYMFSILLSLTNLGSYSLHRQSYSKTIV